MQIFIPARQVCPLCASDDAVELISEGPDLWRFTCSGDTYHDEPYSWSPSEVAPSPVGRTGVGEELGVYDSLRACVLPHEVVEYGIVEHRFSIHAPDAYRELVERYGHASIAPTKYSASAFLAHALGQLGREGILALSSGPATGYWSYLSKVSGWSLGNEPIDQPHQSWATYATQHGLDPQQWPFAAEAR